MNVTTTCLIVRCNLLTETINQDGQERVLSDEHRRRRRASAGSPVLGRPSHGAITWCWRSMSVAGRVGCVAAFLCAGRSCRSERLPRSPRGPDPVHLHRPNIYQARHGPVAACREHKNRAELRESDKANGRIGRRDLQCE